MKIRVNIYSLAFTKTNYQKVWKYQKSLSEHLYQIKKDNNKKNLSHNLNFDSIILVQHPSIYTLGRGATLENIKFDVKDDNLKHELVRVERGGEVTWHGPGQIIAYPIFDLNNHKRDLHWLSNSLEQTVINLLQSHGINATRLSINTGVWVNNNKISAIGVTASRWITMHGVAFNINCDLSHFKNIIPCGINPNEYGVCSLETIKGIKLNDDDIIKVSNDWLKSFANVFNLELNYIDNPEQVLDELLQNYPNIANLELKKSDL